MKFTTFDISSNALNVCGSTFEFVDIYGEALSWWTDEPCIEQLIPSFDFFVLLDECIQFDG